MKKEFLFAKLSKCSFDAREIDYLGYTINGASVNMDKDKIRVVLEWPIPRNIKQLRGFVGLTGYYRRFIKRHATLVAPLANLLKKDSFAWG